MIEVTDAELRQALTASLAVPRWVEDVAGAAPFASLDDLLRVARAAASPLSPAEVDQAIAHHPRIGERAAGDGVAQALSRREQASPDADDAGLAAAIAAGNVAYEERFGRVFLIRAAGRSRAEILVELERRLTLDDPTDLTIAGEQLVEIAMLRLAGLLAPVAGGPTA